MDKISDHLMTETGWELIESNYDPSQSINSGSNFMIGNGFLGYRGTMAEDTHKDYVGCFVTDTWDNADGKWEELCNVPNGLFTQIFVEDTPLSIKQQKPQQFKRRLNFKNGVNSVNYRSILTKDRITVRYHEEKFASLSDYHVIPMKIELTADQDIHLKIIEGIDGKVWNLNGEHLTKYKMDALKNSLYFLANTVEKNQKIVITSHLQLAGMEVAKQQLIKRRNGIFNEIDGYLKKNQPIKIIKYMCVFHSNECSDPLKYAYESNASYDYSEMKKLNEMLWNKKWEKYDIQIPGNIVDETAIRFNTYHSVIATPTHASLPIGARGLSCQAYQGAAFWDQEIFNLPMYLYTDSQIAEKLLKYRYETLNGAKRKAERLGFRGAFYAWISGKTGDELCPDFFFKDVLTDRPIRNHFNDWQIHITPDIVYAYWKYYLITKDEQFLIDYGAEVILESVRFLSTRVVYLPDRKRYELWKIQGPDEYHENVENNAFTNYQTKYAFDIALKVMEMLNKNIPEQLLAVLDRIEMNQREIDLFNDIAEKIYLPSPGKQGVIEQFDGYFGLESLLPVENIKERLIRKDEYYGWPNGVAVYTQAIKQADVIQLITMHPEMFSLQIKQANYDYYEPRTLHFSSLSPSVYAQAAAQIGYVESAMDYFKKSVFIDLKNTNDPVSGGTFIGGIHTAAAGAAWQIVVNGFSGFDVQNDTIYLNPQIPEVWGKLSFSVELRGTRYQMTLNNHFVEVTINDSKHPLMSLSINKYVYELKEGVNRFLIGNVD
ncbi:MAG TPA: glycosyl hydrolase family 65 protein [Thermotogota bacterium]|nr:glycosyl hydrolase family 65 protein [Thermotogota bacterium]